MTFRSQIVAGLTLIREAIQSQNYVTGISGWAIKADGNAEFNNLNIRGTFLGTNFIENESGLFFYADTPAAGNLIGSWSQAAGIDQYGNSYAAGVCTYDVNSAVFSQLTSGRLQIGNIIGGIPDGANSAEVGIGGASLQLISIPDVADGLPNPLIALVSSGQDNVTGPGSTEPILSLLAQSSSAPASLRLSGAAIKTDNSGTVQTWHTVGVGSAAPFNANWSGTTVMGTLSMMPSLRYRFDAEDNVIVQGLFTAAAGAGTAVFQFPPEYRPSINSPSLDLTIRSSSGATSKASAVVSTAGNLNMNSNLGSSAVAGSVYSINGTFPLGNLN